MLLLLLFLFLQFLVTDTSTPLDTTDAFENKQYPLRVWSLHWEAGLDYVIATTFFQVYNIALHRERTFLLSHLLLKVLKVPLEECSSNRDFSSCFSERNPLCGWCVEENKCSRRAQCQNGIRWIPSSIPLRITPDKFPLDGQQLVS